MSAYGYKQTLAGLKTTSASPPGADLPGGVAEGPFLTRSGHFAGYSSNVEPSAKLSNFNASTRRRIRRSAATVSTG